MGHAVGLSPLVVLVSVIGIGYLLGPLYVLIAIPIAAIAATLVDVVVRGRDPAEEEAPAVLFAGTGEAQELAQARRQRPNTRPPSVKPRPNVPAAKAPIAAAFRAVERRCQRLSASRSSSVSSSPRRCLRSAPPARTPR